MKNPTVDYWKLLVTLAAGLYFFNCLSSPNDWHFIDNVNLVIHEAGHVIFLFFGQFLHMLGGSLTQIVLPAIFVVYFFREERYFSASLLLFWVGQNLLNVSIYARDAIVMQLPLLGGDAVIHDWNYLLSTLGILKYTSLIANILFTLGGLTICVAFSFCLWFSRAEVKERANKV